jgi:hypothetical protein
VEEAFSPTQSPEPNKDTRLGCFLFGSVLCGLKPVIRYTVVVKLSWGYKNLIIADAIIKMAIMSQIRIS